MVSFFSENYYKYHYSNYCSVAFIFMVILILFSLLLPFFTNIGAVDKFWLPNKVYTGHPIVQFNNQFLLILTDMNGGTSEIYNDRISDTLVTLNSINFEKKYYSNKNIINQIKVRGALSSTNGIKDIKFFIFFDYYMTEFVNIHIRSKAHIFHSVPFRNQRITKFVYDGDLILKQNKKLVETYFLQEEGTESSFEEEANEVSNDPFNRDENYYFIINKNKINVEYSNNNDLEFEIVINIPYYQDIIVGLPNYTNLKNKWVLYSILFFPTLYVCYWLMDLVINNQIFKTRIRSDIPIKL